MEENTKKVIIIPANQNTPTFERFCTDHKIGIMDFIIDYQVEIKPINLYLVDAIDLSHELAILNPGYIVMLYDEYKANKELVIIIPKEITKRQQNYFNEIKDFLNSVNLMLYLEKEDKIWIPIDKTTTENKVIDILMDELTKRLKNNNLRKVLTKED